MPTMSRTTVQTSTESTSLSHSMGQPFLRIAQCPERTVPPASAYRDRQVSRGRLAPKLQACFLWLHVRFVGSLKSTLYIVASDADRETFVMDQTVERVQEGLTNIQFGQFLLQSSYVRLMLLTATIRNGLQTSCVLLLTLASMSIRPFVATLFKLFLCLFRLTTDELTIENAGFDSL